MGAAPDDRAQIYFMCVMWIMGRHVGFAQYDKAQIHSNIGTVKGWPHAPEELQQWRVATDEG